MTPKRKTTRARLPAKRSDGADPTAVLLEEIRDQMKVVLEAVQDGVTKHEFEARLQTVDARFDAVDARFDAVDGDLRALRHDAMLHAQRGDLQALEQRVQALERRAGE